MGRRQTISNEQLAAVINLALTNLGHPTYETNFEAYDAFLQLQTSERQSVWQFAARRLNKTEQQIRDFFYNTYVRQFYEDAAKYRSEIIQLLNKNEFLAEQTRIKDTCKQILANHTNVNPKALNKFVRKLIAQTQNYTNSASYPSVYSCSQNSQQETSSRFEVYEESPQTTVLETKNDSDSHHQYFPDLCDGLATFDFFDL
uniref:Uncharacterized protein n=1 Tax=Trepomonas sp. PC1 TaxID=1076344 RepID=A0A146KL49_9EUKA|eukprot:JAP96275.1 Hypothetical protein TPC1_10444 [Trepomonas sp. PC1]